MMGGVVATIAAFLATSIGPLVKRALVAIGVGTVTYAGLDVAFAAARDLIVSNYGQMSGSVADLVSLAGVGQAIGIVLGALAARVGLVALTSLGRVL
ncbi:MAG: DUF2523 domain-containing protein [bacterium]|nr:DUF2523 domain-containing protein [bacterium]